MNIKIVLFVSLGFVFLGLGAIGLFLPVWPTTPFVLLAAGCFSGTPRLKRKLMKIRFFREYIENYSHRNGLSRRTIFASLIYLWGMLVLSMVLIQKPIMVLVLSAIGTAVTIHIVYMARPKEKKI